MSAAQQYLGKYQKGPHENKERVDQVKLIKAAKRKPKLSRKTPAKKPVSSAGTGQDNLELTEGGC